MSAHGVGHELGLEEEHPGVPQVLAAGQVELGPRVVGLLHEPRDVAQRVDDGVSRLDVAVARLGPRRHDADRREVPAPRAVEGGVHGLEEGRLVADEVIGGEDRDERVLVAPEDGVRRPRDARRGVARDRLGQEIRPGELGDGRGRGLEQVRARRDVDAIGGEARPKAAHRRGKQRLLAAREGQELLRLSRREAGQKRVPAPPAMTTA